MSGALAFGHQFGNARIVYKQYNSSATPLTVALNGIHAALKLVCASGQTITLALPDTRLSPWGNCLHFIHWNALGTVNFTPDSASDLVNGAASLTYLEASFSGAQLIAVLSVPGHYYVLPLSISTSGASVAARAPNVQVSGLGIDAGHGGAAGTLYLAATPGVAVPTLGAASIALGDQAGLTHGAAVVAAGSIGGDVGANSAVVGTTGSTVAADSAVCGVATGAVSAGGCVLGQADSTVGAGGIVLGNATNAVPANAIVLGTGAASATAGRLNILGGEGVAAQAGAASTHSLAVNIDGTVYYFLCTTVAP